MTQVADSALNKLLEVPIDALLVVDERGMIRMLNANTERMFGYTRGELIGQHMDMLVPERFRVRHESHHEGYYQNPHARPMGTGLELSALRADGLEFPVEISLTPLETGNTTLIAAAIRDMTLLRRSEAQAARLGHVLEHSLNEIYLFSEDTLRFCLVNKGARENLGYSLAELKTLTPLAIKPDYTRASFAALIAPLRAGVKEMIEFTTVHVRKDGSRYPVEIHLQLFQAQGLFVAIALDISERLAAARALREADQRMALHIENTPLAVIEWAADSQLITSWNSAAERVFGYNAKDVVGKKTIRVIVPAEVQPTLEPVLKGAIEPGGYRSTNRNIARDGRTLYCEWYNTPFKNEAGEVTRVAALALDITSRQRAQEALFSAQEEERARISRDLHDGVGQSLTAMLLGIDALAKSPSAEKLEHLKRVAGQTLEDVRRLSRDLRPALLDELGLEAAVKRLGRELSNQIKLTVDVLMRLPERLPKTVEIVAYRVIQEALTNVARHAAAHNVSVIVIGSEEHLHLIVEDDGAGFTTSDVATTEHVGVAGMRERVELLGGNLQIESSPGQGTFVSAHLPI